MSASAPAAAPMLVAAERLSPAEGYQRTRRFTGEVAARRSSELGFELAGKLRAVTVEAGDHVTLGTAIAHLDTARLTARRSELEAERAGAVARLAELEAGPRAEIIAVARAALAEVDEELELARSMLERRTELARRQAVSQEDADLVARTVDVLITRREAATQQLQELERGSRPEVIEAQRAAVARLDAQLASIDVELDKSTLRAPFDGVVAERHLDEGSVLAVGAPVVRLVEEGTLEARIGVSIELAGTLTAGQAVELTAGTRELTGTVRSILPELERVTRTATVIVDLDAASSRRALPGEAVDLAVHSSIEVEGFWLATDTLRRSHHGLWAAYALIEGDEQDALIVERREVEVLYTDGERALVRGALQAGDRVLASGAHRVVPGMLVQAAGH